MRARLALLAALSWQCGGKVQHDSGAPESGAFVNAQVEARARKALAHAALDYDACTLAAAVSGDGHASQAFALRCSGSALELVLGFDDGGKLSRLELRQPSQRDAACRL